jgi:hypothetical protein
VQIKKSDWSDVIENRCCNGIIPQMRIVRKKQVPMVSKKRNVGNIYLFKISEDSIFVV